MRFADHPTALAGPSTGWSRSPGTMLLRVKSSRLFLITCSSLARQICRLLAQCPRSRNRLLNGSQAVSKILAYVRHHPPRA